MTYEMTCYERAFDKRATEIKCDCFLRKYLLTTSVAMKLCSFSKQRLLLLYYHIMTKTFEDHGNISWSEIISQHGLVLFQSDGNEQKETEQLQVKESNAPSHYSLSIGHRNPTTLQPMPNTFTLLFHYRLEW